MVKSARKQPEQSELQKIAYRHNQYQGSIRFAVAVIEKQIPPGCSNHTKRIAAFICSELYRLSCSAKTDYEEWKAEELLRRANRKAAILEDREVRKYMEERDD